jgi:hypothetical protein
MRYKRKRKRIKKEKRRELYIKKYMDENHPRMLYNKKIGRFTVDWYCELEKGNKIVILECDEASHIRHHPYDEYARMLRVSNKLTAGDTNEKKIIWIRLNPDIRIITYGKIRYILNTKILNYRLFILSHILNNKISVHNNKTGSRIKILYLFYQPQKYISLHKLNSSNIIKFNRKLIDDMGKKLDIYNCKGMGMGMGNNKGMDSIISSQDMKKIKKITDICRIVSYRTAENDTPNNPFLINHLVAECVYSISV